MDILSYILGKKAGGGEVIIDDTAQYTFTAADTDGNIVIEEV